jgi:poly-gamma-glutamate synthesis protein (capsule biosynthesis protein)
MAVTLGLAGDTMLGRGVGELLTESADPADYLSEGLLAYIGETDLFLLNLECCISDRGTPWGAPGKPFHFRAPPRAAGLLAEIGVGCVTLANNHALDFGYDALLDTREHLRRVGVQSVGAGATERQAREGVVMAVNGLRIGILGLTDHPADFAARPDRPGVAYADLSRRSPRWPIDRIGELRKTTDAVLVLSHWGPNMTAAPLPYVRSAARELVGAGAALVAGHSAHVFQGVAPPVLYDLGDFIDDYAVDPDLRNDLGLLFLVTMHELGPVLLRAVPLRLEYSRTRLARDDERRWITNRFLSACADLGTVATEENGVLSLAFSPR